MKIDNINTVDEYPDNYDNLTDKMKTKILDYFNDQQALADSYYQKHIIQSEMRTEYLNLYDHVMDLLCGGKNILSVLDIKVEWDWPTGRKQWILATKKDAEAYNVYQEEECSLRQSIKDGLLGWPTPRGAVIK